MGTVTRIAEFGAFVELEPGVEGLVHISELSDQHVRRVEDVVQVGQPVTVHVRDVDEAARRISLTMKGVYSAGGQPTAEAKPKKKRKRPLRGGLD
ncbi:MAG: S1 RNA-binding domain-containing protein [Planctomycetota bacterium]